MHDDFGALGTEPPFAKRLQICSRQVRPRPDAGEPAQRYTNANSRFASMVTTPETRPAARRVNHDGRRLPHLAWDRAAARYSVFNELSGFYRPMLLHDDVTRGRLENGTSAGAAAG
jgi:hypothetical protein